MNSKIRRVSAAVLAVVTMAAMFYACKKVDNASNNFDEEQAVENMKQKISKLGSPQINTIHQRVNSITYGDKNGVEHVLNLNKTSSTESLFPIQAVCDPQLTNCANAAGDPGMLQSPDVYLEYGTRVMYCGSAANSTTSDITVSWQLSVPYNIVAFNPNNSSQLSRGRLTFKNTSNQVIQSYLTITPISITNLGVDPGCADRNVFEIQYTQTGIPNSLFQNGNTMENNFLVYTDCDIVNHFSSTNNIVSLVTTQTATAGTPCSRTDKIWINPGSGPNGVPGALGVGNTINCNFPYGWIYPDLQHLEYKLPASSTWYAHDISPFGYLWMTEITPNSGVWMIRYRNHVNNSCDGPWYYENWTF